MNSCSERKRCHNDSDSVSAAVSEYAGRGVKTLQEVRYKGTKYKDEILRALQGIDQAEEQERAKEGLERSVEYKDYLWKRKESHDVSCSIHCRVFLICISNYVVHFCVGAGRVV